MSEQYCKRFKLLILGTYTDLTFNIGNLLAKLDLAQISSKKLLEKVIIALDFKNLDTTIEFLNKFPDGYLKFVKVGMELFYSEGPSIITYLKSRHLKIFLDLKMHDIPNTVSKALSSLIAHNVDITNIHGMGGEKMMIACKDILKKSNRPPLLIAVTMLTSHSKEEMNQNLRVLGSIEEQVLHLATLTQKVGLDGVVCSPMEIEILRDQLGDDFILVTPGIRSKNSAKGDQVRVMTPKEAFEKGSSYIVMGREITMSDNPYDSLSNVIKDIQGR